MFGVSAGLALDVCVYLRPVEVLYDSQTRWKAATVWRYMPELYFETCRICRLPTPDLNGGRPLVIGRYTLLYV